jgi:hypothetical protein
VLQKSKVAAALIFGENLNHEDIGDSYCLSRATEVAYELACGDEAPQIITPITRQQSSEYLTPSAKRLLQHNRSFPDLGPRREHVCFSLGNGHLATAAAGLVPRGAISLK